MSPKTTLEMEHETDVIPQPGKAWTREPMIWFLIVGGVLSALSAVMDQVRRPTAEVTEEWLQSIVNDQERRLGTTLDNEEKVNLAHQQLEEEILYREALKMGRSDDPRVRGLLAGILREEIEPVLADPSDVELRDYRNHHPEAYQFPAQLSFQHVSYSRKEDIPAGTLEKLRSGGLLSGDPAVKLANPLPMTWMPQLIALFGEEFAMELEKCKVGGWAGPLVSTRGLHFVKLIERREPREMSFEEVKPTLTAQWLKEMKADAVSRKVAEIREGYRVVLPKGIPEP